MLFRHTTRPIIAPASRAATDSPGCSGGGHAGGGCRRVITGGLRRAESRWRAVFLAGRFCSCHSGHLRRAATRAVLVVAPFAGLAHRFPTVHSPPCAGPSGRPSRCRCGFPDQPGSRSTASPSPAAAPARRWRGGFSARFVELQRNGTDANAPDLRDRQRCGHRRAGHPHAGHQRDRVSSSGSTRWLRLFVFWSGVAVMMLALAAGRRPKPTRPGRWGTFVFLVTFFDYHTTGQLVSAVHAVDGWSFRSRSSGSRTPSRPRLAAIGERLRAGRRWTFAALAVARPRLPCWSARGSGADVTVLRVIVGEQRHREPGGATGSPWSRGCRRGPRERRDDELRSAAWGPGRGCPGLLSVGFIFGVLTGSGDDSSFSCRWLAPPRCRSPSATRCSGTTSSRRARCSRRRNSLDSDRVDGPAPAPFSYGSPATCCCARSICGSTSPGASSLGAFRGPRTPRLPVHETACSSRWRGEFRPIIQRLSDDLTSNRDGGARISRQALEAAVLRWLADARRPHRAHDLISTASPSCPPGHRERLSAGEAVWTTESPRKRHLLLPMRSRGRAARRVAAGAQASTPSSTPRKTWRCWTSSPAWARGRAAQTPT